LLLPAQLTDNLPDGVDTMIYARASHIQARASTGCSSGKRAVTQHLDWTEEQAEVITRKAKTADGSTVSWRDAKKEGPNEDTKLAFTTIEAAIGNDPTLRDDPVRFKQVVYNSFRVMGEWHRHGLTEQAACEAYYKNAAEVFEVEVAQE